MRFAIAVLVASLASLVRPAALGGQSASAEGGCPPVEERRASPWEWWFATPKRYFDPLIADPRAAHQQATVGVSKSPPFLQNQTEHAMMWDIDVGAEIPLVGREKYLGLGGRVDDVKGVGAGLWFVFDFHMIEDLKDVSNPILNTDYRFSALFKAQKGLGNTRWLGVKAQAGHESTHLGDEYSLAARRLYEEFTRINVSYEWLDVALSYEWDSPAAQWTTRAGLITTLPFGDSYYTTDTLETNGRIIQPSETSVEPYVGVQRRADLSPNWGWYGAADLRFKAVYDYDKADPSDAEPRRPALNVLVGLWPQKGHIGGLGVASPFVRGYYGVNPHGQFRNEERFWLVGAGLRLDR
jgi:hypothetical protein